MVGSEGTLGIIVELTLRLHPLPESIASTVSTFPSIADAVNTVIQTIQLGVPVARMELLDALTISALNQYSKTTLREEPTLFFEFHGSPGGVQEQTTQVAELAKINHGNDFEWANRPEDRSRLWQARHDALWAAINLKPGSRGLSTDVCVPISRLADCIAETLADIAKAKLPSPIVGHVGDGNFHVVLLIDPNDTDENHRAHAFAARLAERAIRMEGTCTGEHGVGLGKREYLIPEHGIVAIDVCEPSKQRLIRTTSLIQEKSCHPLERLTPCLPIVKHSLRPRLPIAQIVWRQFFCLNSVKASRRAVLPAPTFFTSFDPHQQLLTLQTTQRQRNAA